MNTSGRMNWVDMAKGISILLVVMMYAIYSTGRATGETGFMHYVIGFATPFRMPEFFLLSGLFLGNVIARDWRRFLDRRVVHYLYFYAVWASILIIVKVALFAGDPGRALAMLAGALVEPYSMLWFIYVLAFFGLAAKLAHAAHVPHWLMLGMAAVLQMADVQTPFYAINQFAEYLVYFYGGYVFAPAIFRFVNVFSSRPFLTGAVLFLWAGLNGALVFLPSHDIRPVGFGMGLAALPGLHLVVAFAGALAICLMAVLLVRFAAFGWLRWLGAHSIVVFLGFSLPMSISREVILRLNLLDNTGIISLVVMFCAIVAPVILYRIIMATGRGRFLFIRPVRAHLPGSLEHDIRHPGPAAPLLKNPLASG